MFHGRRAYAITAVYLTLLFLASPAPAGDYYWTQVLSAPVNQYAKVEASGGSLYDGGLNGLYRSDDAGRTWMLLDARRIVAFAADGDTVVWISDALDGVYDTHRSIAKGANPTVLSTAWGNRDYGDTLVLQDGIGIFGDWNGLYISTDGGELWGHPALWDTMGKLRPLSAAAQGTVVLAGMTNPEPGLGSYGGIWRSTQSGAYDTWTNVLTKGYVSAMAFVDPLAVAGTADGLYRSLDGGATWEKPFNDQPPYTGNLFGPFYQFAIADDVVFCSDGRISLSPTRADAGSWLGMSSGLPVGGDTRDMALLQLDGQYTLFSVLMFEFTTPDGLPRYEYRLFEFNMPDGLPREGYDITAPSGRLSVSARGVSSDQLGLAITAYDLPVGQGVGVTDMALMEFHWDSREGEWSLVGESSWTPYQSSLDWTLHSPSGGLLFMAFFRDANGNVSSDLIVDYSTRFPQTTSLVAGQIYWTFVYARAGQTFTITATPESGDPDLFWWSPSNQGYNDGGSWTAGVVPEVMTINPTETGWHWIAVRGWTTDTEFALAWSLGAPSPVPGQTRDAARKTKTEQSLQRNPDLLTPVDDDLDVKTPVLSGQAGVDWFNLYR